MAYFDSHNGWLHLAFYEEQDYYYMPSLVKVGAGEYLTSLLTKAGYELILSLEVPGEEPVFTGLNGPGATFVEERLSGGKKGILFKEKNSFERKCREIFGSSQKIAVITRLVNYEKAFSQEENYTSIWNAINAGMNYRSILIVTAPLLAEASNKILTNPASAIYRQHETVQRAVKDRGYHQNLYEGLKNSMGDRCVYLNDMSRENIYNVVARNFQLECGDESAQELAMSVEVATEVIYRYYHLPYKELICGGYLSLGLSRNPMLKTDVLDMDLKNPGIRKKLISFQEQDGGGNHYYMERVPITSNSNRLVSWSQLEAELERVDHGVESVAEDIRKVREYLQNLALRGENTLLREETESMISDIRRMLKSPRREYHCRMLTTLRLFLGFAYDGDEEWRSGLKQLCETIRDLCYTSMDLEENIANSQSHLAEIHAEIQNSVNIIQNQMGTAGVINANADSIEELKVSSSSKMLQMETWQDILKKCRDSIMTASQNLQNSKQLNYQSLNASIVQLSETKDNILKEVLEVKQITEKYQDHLTNQPKESFSVREEPKPHGSEDEEWLADMSELLAKTQSNLF